jgi:aryl-alcohol dehydrogenase-like predicted oxidoreductase
MGAEHIHTADNIRTGVEQGLRRMKTDYLDLVQFHRSLTRREFEEHGALEAALALKREGKVRFIGVSGTLPNLVEQIEMGVFDAFQIPYSALQREHEEVISGLALESSYAAESRAARLPTGVGPTICCLETACASVGKRHVWTICSMA